ncbi:hypothetical protein BO85DRAFT_463953 [Aspergillus piperis CBS 112811]|uniref:Uncharacterized protein n=1 Tax=Aspergillus piperis CBS 112811 TaxID=1448313 RepID=A0A8G1VGK3_9EURO|nr:hypothetical protein BO85DRAFT_463953 [Aspergillus piperis CBS 112811]RAH52371.1 hypothetical protein BO85DRAFT_463953 [Aspergillus piperis CBS 112811]
MSSTVANNTAPHPPTIHYPQPERPASHGVTPPFSSSASIRSSPQHTHPAGRGSPTLSGLPAHNAEVESDYHLLWLAGLPRAARPLHRQKLMKRAIILTESPDEHLVWSPGQILIKPVPEYLLDHEFWVRELCPHRELHAAACGLLLSYAWLITGLIDFQLAKDERILPFDVTWDAWTLLIRQFLEWVDNENDDDRCISQPQPAIINKRYEFGELRLSRLNSLYRLAPVTFSIRNLVFGFLPSSTWYQEFFERNFSWILAVLVYMSVLLSAMQVGLATQALQGNQQFQRVCVVFTLASIFFTVVLADAERAKSACGAKANK